MQWAAFIGFIHRTRIETLISDVCYGGSAILPAVDAPRKNIMLKKLHHAAYRCRDAAETVDFYTKSIGMKFAATMINLVPSTGLKATNSNVFFEMEDGSYICFFEILGSKEPVVPVENDWAQHLALEVRDDARAGWMWLAPWFTASWRAPGTSTIRAAIGWS
ncbi:VOC family protein [Ralstonia solanacearum]|uniref:VOC family protein n=1 Tax=Ralstonia solanacearum TaxID=305 RepID=UPI001E407484|nr:VOC family protein [Ralstonia solanacearum]